MKKNTFKSFKEAIITRYAVAQSEDHSGILATPTPAQLRDFCVMKYEKGLTVADEEVMKAFFGTKQSESLKQSISNCNIDKFKPIISFLKGEKDSENQIRVGLAAIIVDFKPRPFAKFLGGENNSKDKEDELENGIDKVTNDNSVINKPKLGLLKKVSVVVLGVIGLSSAGYGIKNFVSPKKQCMQWQEEHYELVDCNSEVNGLYASAPIVPIDEDVLDLNKVIRVSDTTTFFEGDKAIIWYCKVNGEPEFFNGPGLHPITGKALRPVTPYIIGKYVKK